MLKYINEKTCTHVWLQFASIYILEYLYGTLVIIVIICIHVIHTTF
jgi:hypothetical protein